MAGPTKPNIAEIRPPNPYDFSSLCEFLEQVLRLDGIIQEYSRMMQIMEQNASEKSGANDAGKPKGGNKIFSDDQFEFALIRTLEVVSTALLRFKEKSLSDQEVKRPFLLKDNDSNIQNALTTAGFPDMFGRNIIGKRIPELKTFNLYKALHKANAVFNRAFYFMVKENELTKKPIDELIEALKKFTEEDDLKQYLETLLYKVEVASTENSFNSMKKKVAEPLQGILNDTIKEMAKYGMGGEGEEPAADKVKAMTEADRLAYEAVRVKVEILKLYLSEYFASTDFVFVEKNLLQFKKAKAEQEGKSNKPILSDDFLASIERKLMIQLISAFKKAYNAGELNVLKCYMLHALLGEDAKGEMSEAQIAKFQSKKKIIIDALKRIRTDMIVEDIFNTTSENKKLFIEAFEKELFSFTPKQLQTQVLPGVEKKAEDLVSHAKRAINKKSDDQEHDKEEAALFQQEVNLTGLNVMRYIFDLHLFNSGRSGKATLQEYTPIIDPQIKTLESTIKRLGKGKEQDDKKAQVRDYLSAYAEGSKVYTGLAPDKQKVFQIYLKGLIDRISYW